MARALWIVLATQLAACAAPAQPLLTVNDHVREVDSYSGQRTALADRTDVLIRLVQNGDGLHTDSGVTYVLHIALAPDVATDDAFRVDGTTTFDRSTSPATESFAPGPQHDARVLAASTSDVCFCSPVADVERVSGTIDVVAVGAEGLALRVDLTLVATGPAPSSTVLSYHYTGTFTAR